LVQDNCWVCGTDILPEDNFCRICGVKLVLSDRKSKSGRGTAYGDRRVPVGIFLIVFGVVVAVLSYLMTIIPILALGLASFLIGILMLYLPESSGAIAGRLATDSSLPALLNTEKLLEDLDLDERGIYIPAAGLGVCPKVFVPLVQTPITTRPPLGLIHSRRIFATVGKKPEDRGVLLEAPGCQILTVLEQTLNADLSSAGSDTLKERLNSGLKAIGIAKVTTLEFEDDEVKAELQLMALVDLEVKLRNLAPRLVAQVGTPVASAVAAAISKATMKYVTFKSAVLSPNEKRITLSLRLSS
jgi:hypothetical protein